MVGVKRGATISNTSYCSEHDSTFSTPSNSTLEDNAAEFHHWTTKDQGLLLSSYYYGYFICQMPAAWLSAKLGFKKVLGCSMILASFLTLIFPLAVRLSYGLGLACRVVLGVAHAAVFPAMTDAFGVWAPPLERSKLFGICVSGASFGTCIIFPMAGFIAHKLGWPAIFYTTGTISIVWCFFWTFLVYDTPEKNPRISSKEKEYIMATVVHSQVDRTKLDTPYRSILTSLPVWGIILGHTASNWGNYMLNSQLPTYYANVLRFDLSTNGLISALPYVLQWFVCMASSWLTDFIRSKHWVKTISIRKINTLMGLWGSGICLVLAGYSGCNASIATSLFILAAGLNTLTVPGCKSSILDTAPVFSGLVLGLSNSVANIPGFLAPTVVGLMLQSHENLDQWIRVFWVSAGLQAAASIVFLIWGQDKVQQWAQVEDQIQTLVKEEDQTLVSHNAGENSKKQAKDSEAENYMETDIM